MNPTDQKSNRADGEREAERPLTVTIGAVLIAICGVAIGANALWFIVGDHPFNDAGGYADEFGMTRAEVDRFNPELSDWVLHVVDQLGAASLGWSLFVIALAVGVWRMNRGAWFVLWLGVLPTLVIGGFGELVQFGTIDIGTAIALGVLAVFIVGMLLSGPAILRRHRSR